MSLRKHLVRAGKKVDCARCEFWLFLFECRDNEADVTCGFSLSKRLKIRKNWFFEVVNGMIVHTFNRSGYHGGVKYAYEKEHSKGPNGS